MIFDEDYFYSDDDPHGIFELDSYIFVDQDSQHFLVIPCNDPDLEAFLFYCDQNYD